MDDSDASSRSDDSSLYEPSEPSEPSTDDVKMDDYAYEHRHPSSKMDATNTPSGEEKEEMIDEHMLRDFDDFPEEVQSRTTLALRCFKKGAYFKSETMQEKKMRSVDATVSKLEDGIDAMIDEQIKKLESARRELKGQVLSCTEDAYDFHVAFSAKKEMKKNIEEKVIEKKKKEEDRLSTQDDKIRRAFLRQLRPLSIVGEPLPLRAMIKSGLYYGLYDGHGVHECWKLILDYATLQPFDEFGNVVVLPSGKNSNDPITVPSRTATIVTTSAMTTKVRPLLSLFDLTSLSMTCKNMTGIASHRIWEPLARDLLTISKQNLEKKNRSLDDNSLADEEKDDPLFRHVESDGTMSNEKFLRVTNYGTTVLSDYFRFWPGKSQNNKSKVSKAEATCGNIAIETFQDLEKRKDRACISPDLYLRATNKERKLMANACFARRFVLDPNSSLFSTKMRPSRHTTMVIVNGIVKPASNTHATQICTSCCKLLRTVSLDSHGKKCCPSQDTIAQAHFPADKRGLTVSAIENHGKWSWTSLRYDTKCRERTDYYEKPRERFVNECIAYAKRKGLVYDTCLNLNDDMMFDNLDLNIQWPQPSANALLPTSIGIEIKTFPLVMMEKEDGSPKTSTKRKRNDSETKGEEEKKKQQRTPNTKKPKTRHDIHRHSFFLGIPN